VSILNQQRLAVKQNFGQHIISAPSGSWDSADNGVYTLALEQLSRNPNYW
jgi:hypothetical protein